MRALVVEEANKTGLTASDNWLNKVEQVLMTTLIKHGKWWTS